ncbi:MAG: hypothetical protein WD511_00720 [Balneolaceae bacterium]
MNSHFDPTYLEINFRSFEIVEAALVDEIYALESEMNGKTDLAKYKLNLARHINPDFEEMLSEMICGEKGNSFPYRKGYQLTEFFQKLGFSFTHDDSTRRYWVRDTLYQLDIHEISKVVKKGLFNRFSFKRLKIPDGLTPDQAFEKAVKEFRDFVDDSIKLSEGVDLGDLLDLSINTDILFSKSAETSDKDLNQLISEAKNRFIISNDKHIALEKIWDAFERLKTFYDSNKKKSVNLLLDLISNELERDYLNKEFKVLTEIGNEYRIRHHETDKKEIKDPNLMNYLFFRMLSLLDFCISKINSSDKVK